MRGPEPLTVTDRHTQNDGAELGGELSLTMPGRFHNAQLAFLLESEESLPELSPLVEDHGRSITCHTLNGEQRHWYWINSPLDSLSTHELRYAFAEKSVMTMHGDFSAWLLFDRELHGHEIELPGFAASTAGDFLLPAPSALKKENICLFRRPL